MPQVTLVLIVTGLIALIGTFIGLGYYLGWFRFTKLVTVEKVRRTLTTAEKKRLDDWKKGEEPVQQGY
jgi:hypothetical protein